MAILADKESRVLVQGMTGEAGRLYTERMILSGTRVVGGTSPGNGGQTVCDQPLYDTVAECVESTQARVSVILLPAPLVKEAAIESIRAGIELLVVVPERVPVHDMLQIRQEALDHQAVIIGGGSVGVVTPGETCLGVMSDAEFIPGCVGVVVSTGASVIRVAELFKQSGFGVTTCVGLGGDLVPGSAYADTLLRFEDDELTRAVVMCGKTGGLYERQTCNLISEMRTPVLVCLDGTDETSKRWIGHASSIVEGTMATAEDSATAFTRAGAHLCGSYEEIPETLKSLGI